MAAKKTAPKKAAKKKATPKKAKPATKKVGAKKTSSKAKAGAKKAASKKAPSRKSAKKPTASKKSSTKKATSKKPVVQEPDPAAQNKPKALSGAAKKAAQIMISDTPAAEVAKLGEQLSSGTATAATGAARVLHELVEQKPELVVQLVEKFARGLTSKHKRVVQTSADALPAIAKIAPAKVARHLEILKASYEPGILDGRDGLVRTFSALCTASVAYQKRLEPSLTHALAECDAKTLNKWSRIVLPALKGEPHARAREVVEKRLYRIPRSVALEIAEFLNMRLRVRY